jgi:3-oxoacyl-[acyl-carrier protein] reductase
MNRRERRVALVTGGSRGIGLGIARCLAEAGFDLAINGRRPDADVAIALAELNDLGARAIYCRADVGEIDEHQRLVDAVRAEFGRLHVLVNNAGVPTDHRGDLLDATLESFDRVLGINLRGPYFLTQRVARWMIDERRADASFGASIINVSSVSATIASTSRGDYCISKAGIAMATRLWAARLGEFGIPVYEVRPGIIRSDMTAAVAEKYDRLIAEGLTVEPRWGEPEDVGRAVAALATGAVPYATGAVLPIDGGLTLERL